MSSIEGMSGTGSELYALRQQFLQQSGAQGGTRQSQGGVDANFLSAAIASGLDANEADSLQEEIMAAISEAEESDDNTSDRRKLIQETVDSVLEKHGVNLDQFRQEMQAVGGKMGGPPPGGAGGPPPGQGPGGSRQAEFESAFADAAVAAGLDPEETDSLQEEIDAAIAEALEKAQSTDDAEDPRQAIQSAVDAILQNHGVNLDTFKTQLQSLLGDGQGMISLVDEQA